MEYTLRVAKSFLPREDVVTTGLTPDNFFAADPNLAFLLRLWADPEDAARAEPHLRELGGLAAGELDRLATLANQHPPVLRAFDREGNRVDEVVYHPAYRELERFAFERFGLAAMSHRAGVLGWPRPVPHVVKYAFKYLFVQAEFGLICPVSLTDSTARIIRLFGSPDQQARYLPRLTATSLADLWQGAQFITEKEAGSDVGAIKTVARLENGVWRLYGHKWFCSNVSAEVIITLARPEGAEPGTRSLGMFLVPKWLPDGTRNSYRIERLKEKLGSRSMATGEVTFDGTVAEPVGDLGRGFKQMAEMINVSRLSNALRSAGLMRRAFFEALNYARRRTAFGRTLADLPLVRHKLFDLLLDVEGCAALVFYGAWLLDRADTGEAEAARLRRIVTPLAKFYVTRRARKVVGEALELLGGNGYIEEWPLARLLRDAYLGSIWEGTTNIVALDVLRAILREGAGEALLEELKTRLFSLKSPPVRHLAGSIQASLGRFQADLGRLPEMEPEARELEAPGLARQLTHLAVTVLLFWEADRLAVEAGNYRKLGVAAAYARSRVFNGPIRLAPGLVRGLVDWQPVGPEVAVPAD